LKVEKSRKQESV